MKTEPALLSLLYHWEKTLQETASLCAGKQASERRPSRSWVTHTSVSYSSSEKHEVRRESLSPKICLSYNLSSLSCLSAQSELWKIVFQYMLVGWVKECSLLLKEQNAILNLGKSTTWYKIACPCGKCKPKRSEVSSARKCTEQDLTS